TATPTATRTATATATATRTPTATATPPAATTATPTSTTIGCAPRPSVGVAALANGDSRLRVTLTAATNPGSATNRLTSGRFTRLDNADVEEFAGPPPITAPGTIALPSPATQTTFFVRRATAGQATTLHMDVMDGCPNPWPTFVGGGPSAF